MYMYYTLLLKTEIISFFLKRSMHLKRTYILRRHKEVIIVFYGSTGSSSISYPFTFLKLFKFTAGILPQFHITVSFLKTEQYINSNNHSLLMKQVNLVPCGSSRQKLGLLSVIHAQYSTQPLAVQPPVSDHPKCKYLVEVACGRRSLMRIEPQISFYMQFLSGPNTCIYNWERINLLHAI